MALALSSLIDGLITILAKIPDDQKQSPRVQTLRKRVEGALRPGTHGRTNQFAVARKLEGLQEKFRVLNRDELADALSNRLKELESYRDTWHPEILSLLLQLSDRPDQLSNLDRLPTPADAPNEEKSLLWSDLNAQGTAYNNEDIWEEVDFAADSSEDDLLSISDSGDALSSKLLPVTSDSQEKEYVIPDEVFLSGEDEYLIASVENAQFWTPKNHQKVAKAKEDASCIITELQCARETIFMLQGLPTSIFWRLDDDIEVDRSYTLAYSSSTSLSSLLRQFAEIGAKLDIARRFTQIPQTIPYLQTFCQGVEERLLVFDRTLSQIQCEYLSPGSTVSLIQLIDDVRRYSRNLEVLADLITRMDSTSAVQPMRCLDLLYNLVCMVEALGDENATKDLAVLFFLCFKTYTRSIQLWMETGTVDSKDNTFFVRVNRENGELRTLWHDWFVLDEGSRQQNIPLFLEPGVQKVFTTGKSMVFLHHLNALPDISENESSDTVFDAMYPPNGSSSHALPFSVLVETAFDRLVDANHSLSSGLLRRELDEQCGLWTSLDALQHVYLGKNLSILSTIDAKIFDLMDRGRSWDDKFLITEVTRSAFSAMHAIDPSKLVVRSAGSSASDPLNRTVKVLETISIDYVLPWPVANIITQDTIQSYRRISTFLMQIRRAKYAIVRERVRDARTLVTDGRDDTLVRALHHKLLWFLESLYSHLTYLVISTTEQSFRTRLSDAEDVDAMISTHQAYTSSLEEQCLLSENLAPLHEAVINILDLCIHFADLQTARVTEEDHNSKKNLSRADGFDSDSEEEEEDGFHDQTLTISFRESPFDHQMRYVKRQFDHLASFVADGLKGVARADGLPSWNILADRMEWRKGWLKL
jgi:gamma-tubulin complex component 5